MTSLSPSRQTARILLETRSVLFAGKTPFRLTSGKASPVYVDCRNLLGYPRARARLMALAVELLDSACGLEAFDGVAGGETAGIPFAALLAERLHTPMAYVRKKPKGFGRQARIEGRLPGDGGRVLLVEDLATDGASKADFIDALRTAGARVEHVFVLFHYGIFPESRQIMADKAATLHALTSWAEVVDEAEAQGYFPDPEALVAIRDFLADPHSWQARHSQG